MNPKKLKPREHVLIEWVDSATDPGWRALRGYAGKVGEVSSVGYVVDCNEDCITITTSIADGNGILDPVAIPWGAVMSLKRLD